MDPVQIIVTVAACIGALVVLYFALAVTVAIIAAKKAGKVFEDFDKGFESDFFKRNRR